MFKRGDRLINKKGEMFEVTDFSTKYAVLEEIGGNRVIQVEQGDADYRRVGQNATT